MQIEEQYLPLIGEVAWHSINIDPRIAEESSRHYDLVREVLRTYSRFQARDLHILEIASYAHTTGYRLASELGAHVTLFEISRHSLSLGRNLARLPEKASNPRLVIGDFHALPFEDHSFNFIYICSALHHTWNYQVLIREMARVLAPGGLLFLENEPTLRRFCFYKFRCNRIPDFTPLEKKLTEFELIRTVAEPYVGSRPEMLFGMIENQQIPLEDLLAVIQENCEIEAMDLAPELCMGHLENYLVQQREQGAERLTSLISTALQERCHQARPYLTSQEQGLGRALPSAQEIQDLSVRIAPELAGLPANSQDPAFRFGLARVFGAPLRLIAGKGKVEGRQQDSCHMFEKAVRFNSQYPQQEGIYHCFPEHVNRLLDLPSCLPDIQTASFETLQAFFHPDDWAFFKGPEGIVSVANRTHTAKLHLPALAGDKSTLLAVLRIYCAVSDHAFYELKIHCAGRCLFTHGAFQAETILFAQALPAPLLSQGQNRLELTLEAKIQHPPASPFRITIPFAGFFAMA